MPGTATVALPQRGARDGPARRSGHRRHRGVACRTTPERPAVVHPGPVRAAGEDGDRGCGRGTRCGERACRRHGIAESDMFAPATLSEYLGLPLDFGDRVDLGGATAAGMVWRAAAAVELGLCDAVLAVVPGSTEIPRSEARPGRTLSWYGASSNNYGSPQAEFEIPYGNVGQNGPYAQIAQRYAAEFGYDAAALARIAVHQRDQRVRAPGRGVPRQADHRRRRAEQPGDRRPDPHARDRDAGAGRRRRADRQRRRRAAGPSPAGVDQGFRRAHPVQDADLRRRSRSAHRSRAPPNGRSRWRALQRSDVDIASIYDCYTITVLMTLEDAGFCGKGEGMAWLTEHDLTFRGDFPVNTAGGQLSFGQAGHGRRHAPRRRRRPPGDGSLRRRAGGRLQHRVRRPATAAS